MPRSRNFFDDFKTKFYFLNGHFNQKIQADEVHNKTSSSHIFLINTNNFM